MGPSLVILKATCRKTGRLAARVRASGGSPGGGALLVTGGKTLWMGRVSALRAPTELARDNTSELKEKVKARGMAKEGNKSTIPIRPN